MAPSTRSKRGRPEDDDDDDDGYGEVVDTVPTPVRSMRRAVAVTPASRLHAKQEEQRRLHAAPPDDHDGVATASQGTDDTADPAALPARQLADNTRAGSILAVELVNFLTHANLKLQLGPNVNFLHGANGSGKSAVLASIMVALGAKTTNTGRGRSLVHLIKDGKPSCTIRVFLVNSGPDAFKPDVFGKVIVVERRISRGAKNQAQSAYAIRNASNKTVSNAKRDLTAITDHFNIQVNNSLTWLTQDAAKEFLMNVKDTDLYRFFARGADIVQTQEAYRTIGEQLTDSAEKLHAIKESMADLRERRKQKKMVWNDFRAMAQWQRHLEALDTEEAWCQIAEMEHNLDQLQQLADENAAKAYDATLQADHVRQNLAEHDAHVAEIEADAPAFDDQVLQQKTRQYDQLKTAAQALNRELRQLERDLTAKEQDLADLNERIQYEAEKLSGPGQDELRLRREALENTRAKLDHLKQNHQRACLDLDTAQRDATRLQTDFHGLQTDLRRHKDEASKKDNAATDLERMSQNAVNRWGRSMVNILRAISQTHWRGCKPIGPLGLHVRPLPEHRQWLDVQQNEVGKAMYDFLVSDFADRDQLAEIFKQSRHVESRITVVRHPERPILLNPHDLPDRRFLTLMDTFEFAHPAVKRVLCINNRIEATVLMDKRDEAERETLHGYPSGVNKMLTPDGASIGSRFGGKSMQYARGWTAQVSPFAIDDVHGAHPGETRADTIARFRREAREHDDMARQVEQSIERARRDMTQTNDRVTQLRKESQRLNDEIMRLTNDLRQLAEEVVDEQPGELAALEHERNTMQEQLDVLRRTIDGMRERFRQMQHEAQAVRQDIQRLEQHRLDLQQWQSDVAVRMRRAAETRTRLERNIEYYEGKHAEHANTRDRYLEEVRQQQSEITRAIADMPGERPQQLRTQREIHHDATRLQAVIHQTRAQYPADMTEAKAEAEWRAIDVDYQRAKSSHGMLAGMIHQLRDALAQRAQAFDLLIQYISASTAMAYKRHMSKRGFDAELRFDHENKMLHANPNVMGDGLRGGERSIKTYSGGEKSFSTVCLLLALWDAMPSPIRCLDEFDVFQDEINRRTSMQLLMDAAEKMDSQFVFITPLAINNIRDNPNVRILHLSDPERNNVAAA